MELRNFGDLGIQGLEALGIDHWADEWLDGICRLSAKSADWIEKLGIWINYYKGLDKLLQGGDEK